MIVTSRPPLHSRWLGRVLFSDALRMQEEIVASKTTSPQLPDELLLLEHEPVYTIGRTLSRSSLCGTNALPYPLFEINRGGQATFHGPGQLVGYPLIDLQRYGCDLGRYLRVLEQILINALREYGIEAHRREKLTGVWIGERKIASIGVGVRHWITMHGFALNVGGDLSPFAHIVPCGISGVEMTSLQREIGHQPMLESVAERVADSFKTQFDELALNF